MNYYKQFLLVYMFTILQLVFTQKPYDNVTPFFGCRFCKSCGDQYTYYGGSKLFDSNSQQNNGWKFFGEECSDQYVAGTDQQWKLCCGRDQALGTGLCRLCSTCGGDYKNNNGSRKSNTSSLALISSIFGDNCSSTILFNTNINYSLCCTQKNVVSLCFKCNYGQIEGGMYQIGKYQEIFNVNQMGSCGINDQYFTQIDNYYLCNNKYCPDNYVFKYNQCFYKCIDNCQICSSLTTCSQCFQNYNLIEGKCVFSCPIQNCEVCSDEAIQQCIKCAKGFYIYQGQCLQCSLPNCQTCFFISNLKSVICQACQKNYNLNTNLIQCDVAPCPENCLKCSEPNVCLQCKEGYKQEIQQQQIICTVFLCPIHCKCQQDNICSSCQDGYKLVTQNDLTKNFCQIVCPTNCEICDSPLTCTKCQSGYSIDSKQKCQYCNIENCKECYYEPSASKFVCKECEKNYINSYQQQGNITEITCIIPCPLNCEKCSEPNICLKCKDRYRQQIQQQQIVCTPIICPQFCICDQDNISSSCQDGYQLITQNNYTQNICKHQCPMINCEICNLQTPQICIQCEKGYVFNSQNGCLYCNIKNCRDCRIEDTTLKFLCNKCDENYILTQNAQQCIASCPENCESCIEPNVCLKCNQRYRQISDKNQITCQGIICPLNCKFCVEDFKCNECEEGFELSQNQQTCTKVVCKPGCTCSKYIIESCVPGMSIYNNQCIPQCAIGRYFDQNECKLCQVPFCQSCSSGSVCTLCQNQYTLQLGYYNFEEKISCLLEEQCKGQNNSPISRGIVCIQSSTSILSLLNIEIIILITYLLI